MFEFPRCDNGSVSRCLKNATEKAGRVPVNDAGDLGPAFTNKPKTKGANAWLAWLETAQ
jgi:hypothetical protein